MSTQVVASAPGVPPKDEKGKRLWITAAGDVIPSNFPRKIDKDRDRLAFKVAKEAMALQDRLKALKDLIYTEGDLLYSLMQEDNHIRTGRKGNYTISSFGKEVRISVTIQQYITWGEEVEQAKACIFKYLNEKLSDKEEALRGLIYSAFETSKGNLDTQNLLKLMKYPIKDDNWKKGMEFLVSAMNVDRSKRRIDIEVRNAEGKFVPVSLNFSSL